MIKIYGTTHCPMCKTLEFWRGKTTMETEYIHVTTDEQKQELQKDYDVFGFPVVINSGVLTTFNDCMDLFKKNKKAKQLVYNKIKGSLKYSLLYMLISVVLFLLKMYI